jgi:hypothetical protein
MVQFSSFFLLLSLSILNPIESNDKDKNESSIKGVIVNEHDTPIENALIYLNKEEELIKVTTSDTLGKYEFTEVQQDTYTISVSYVGYFKKEIKNIAAGKGKKEIDITMKELRCTHGH